MKKVALIMAGGHGERFWPKSRKRMPKQFLTLSSENKSILQLTVERIENFIGIQDIYISTNSDYKGIVLKQLPEISEDNIICEPFERNTAACIGLAAVHIESKMKDALMVVLPSDLLIKNKVAFFAAIQTACDISLENDNLTTIGITPCRPETAYGYLKIDDQSFSRGSFRVQGFYEKPDFAIAQGFLESDQYLWNSGIFIWKASSILSNIYKYIPDTYRRLMLIRDAINTKSYNTVLRKQYQQIEAVSIDRGVMEKAENVFSVPGSFYWDDIGSWQALDRMNMKDDNGNVILGDFVTLNTHNCVLSGHSKLIAAIGLNQLIIVDTEDAMLICHKDHAADIKDALKLLQNIGREDLL